MQCIVVNWWGVEAEVVYWEIHALNRTIKKWRNKLATATAEAVLQSFFQSYMESSHPEETYPYDQNTIVMVKMVFLSKVVKTIQLVQTKNHFVYRFRCYGILTQIALCPESQWYKWKHACTAYCIEFTYLKIQPIKCKLFTEKIKNNY